jgi:hypothetical protein
VCLCYAAEAEPKDLVIEAVAAPRTPSPLSNGARFSPGILYIGTHAHSIKVNARSAHGELMGDALCRPPGVPGGKRAR